MMYTPKDQIPVSVRRRAAAIHEAAHALVGIVLGRKVTGAILRPPDGTNGETQFENEPAVVLDPHIEADRHTIENAIVVLLAGQVAEAVYWKQVSGLYNPYVDTHRDDDAMIDELKACFGFSPQKEAGYMDHCRANTEHLVMQSEAQAAIDEIASTLEAARTIDRAQLDAILRKHDVIA